MKLKNKQILGFTMIELLVVISIIGILASIALVSYTSVQKQARNTQRKSDLKQFQLALEQFANSNNGFYNSRLDENGAWGSTVCSDIGMTNCPEDPSNDDDSSYQYWYKSDGTDWGNPTATEYIFWGKIEKSTTTYLILCSNGQIGEATTIDRAAFPTCPL